MFRRRSAAGATSVVASQAPVARTRLGNLQFGNVRVLDRFFFPHLSLTFDWRAKSSAERSVALTFFGEPEVVKQAEAFLQLNEFLSSREPKGPSYPVVECIPLSKFLVSLLHGIKTQRFAPVDNLVEALAIWSIRGVRYPGEETPDSPQWRKVDFILGPRDGAYNCPIESLYDRYLVAPEEDAAIWRAPLAAVS